LNTIVDPLAAEIKLSVVIPCLNAAATLPVQLTALCMQNYTEPWEVVVVDNGSTDDTVKVARTFQAHLPAFTVITAAERKGAAHARNAGVMAARSDNIAFCDADDEVAADWVAHMAEALSLNMVVYGRFRFDKFNDPVVAARANRFWENGLVTLRFLPGGGSGNLGVRRHVHEAIGGFDEDLPRSEDADYYWRLQLEGFALHFVPEAIVQVRRERVNPSLGFLYRRRRDTIASNYWSYKRYKHLGMQAPLPWSRSFREWTRLVKRMVLFKVRTRRQRTAWMRQFAHATGEVVGQLYGRLRTPCEPYRPRDLAAGIDPV